MHENQITNKFVLLKEHRQNSNGRAKTAMKFLKLNNMTNSDETKTPEIKTVWSHDHGVSLGKTEIKSIYQ